MGFETSTWMMIAFVLGMIFSVWKLYPFLATKTLADDDNTPEAREKLLGIVLETIKGAHPTISLNELFEKVKEHPKFDKEHFWRFNPNKLKHLLEYHYAKNPSVNSIEDIYKAQNDEI